MHTSLSPVILNYFDSHIQPLAENGGHSFVLLTCDEKYINSAIDEIKSIQIVTGVDRIQGIYDILVQLKASNETMKETTRTKIRYVNGVRSVLTLFAYDTSS